VLRAEAESAAEHHKQQLVEVSQQRVLVEDYLHKHHKEKAVPLQPEEAGLLFGVASLGYLDHRLDPVREEPDLALNHEAEDLVRD